NAVAGLQQDDVAGNQFGDIDRSPLSVAQDLGTGGYHPADRVQSAFGPAFLDKPDDGVDGDDRDDDGSIDRVAQDERAYGGGQQEIDEDIVELQQETQDGVPAARGGQLVGSMDREALPSLVVGQ